MPTLLERQVRPESWVQVLRDPERAGSGLLNFVVDDLEGHLAEVGARGHGMDIRRDPARSGRGTVRPVPDCKREGAAVEGPV